MIIDELKWQSWINSNKDDYGKACVDVAREVMRMLDTDEYKEFEPNIIICKADDVIGAGGITGFMVGCVASMVSQVHSRGEEFKKKWNESYGVKDERKGVVNPAIITIKEEEVNNNDK